MNYCYWSIGVGRRRASLQACVNSARQAGVFREFHVFSDHPLKDCNTYDAMTAEAVEGIESLLYMKAGLSKLSFDCFIWIDPASRFCRNPNGPLAALNSAPIHVPLEFPVDEKPSGFSLDGLAAEAYGRLFTENGVYNRVYYARAAFWIVKRAAIDAVFDWAKRFMAAAEEAGHRLDERFAISYVTQLLGADPERHTWRQRPDLWSPDSGPDAAEKGSAIFLEKPTEVPAFPPQRAAISCL
ncbi:MAG: hypothetical protein M2R45_00880 [Verrucomicrobia subdivision 3 bacterium]|nr:hypothetical protein [Limisphaerales bacterium]MCS1414548.1 hypothetical protein [Limisphaerales bacterium]